MQDHLGREIRIGELVSVSGHPELDIKVNWIVMGWIDNGVAVEAILQNFIDGSTAFVNILDLEKEFS
jgi:hypothetical protein